MKTITVYAVFDTYDSYFERVFNNKKDVIDFLAKKKDIKEDYKNYIQDCIYDNETPDSFEDYIESLYFKNGTEYRHGVYEETFVIDD